MPSTPAERRLIVDRFEGDLVVVEVAGGATADLPRWLLPLDAREGSHLRVRTGPDGAIEISLDEESTRSAAADALARLERLAAGDPGGDLTL